MNLDAEDLVRLFSEAVASVEGEELRPALEKLATRLLEIGRMAIPLMMMSWSNPDGCDAQTPAKRTAYRTLVMKIIGFFEDQVHRGRLRPVDAEVMARTFMGSIHHYTMTRLMAQDDGLIVVPEGMFVRGLVDILLYGAAAPERAAASERGLAFTSPDTTR